MILMKFKVGDRVRALVYDENAELEDSRIHTIEKAYMSDEILDWLYKIVDKPSPEYEYYVLDNGGIYMENAIELVVEDDK